MAVYTQVSDDDLIAFLDLYDIGALTGKTAIAEGIENTNYRIETTSRAFILTLFEKRTNKEDLPFFMAFMAHLNAIGLPTPEPIKTKTGAIIGVLADRPAVIIEFLPGRPIMQPGAQHCAAAGATLAKMHGAVRDFPLNRKNSMAMEEWRNLAAACGSAADQCAPGLAALIDDELTQLSTTWPTGLPKGVIHADFFPDNILFENDAIGGVIDFYFSCTECFAYDIAICVNSWCFDQDRKLKSENARTLMRAYFEHRNFTAAEIEAFPIFLRAAALRILLTRLYDWLNQIDGAIVTVKDPLEYRDILEFHRRHYAPSLYGFTL